jgi:hypothetical protein
MPAGEVAPAVVVLMIEKPLRSIVTLSALTTMPSLVDDPLTKFAVRKYDPGAVSVVPKAEIGVRGSIWSSDFIVGAGAPGGASGPWARTVESRGLRIPRRTKEANSLFMAQ